MSGSVILNAYHRSFLGLDDFLGHVAVPLSQFQIYERPRSRYLLFDHYYYASFFNKQARTIYLKQVVASCNYAVFTFTETDSEADKEK